MLAMILYPDTQRKAQEELDEVVGRQRAPTFEDRERLPYICAMIKELLRWRPPGPLGVPRGMWVDDWYDGYLIPKGSLIIPNYWAMHHDPEVFPEPDEFRPERFLHGSDVFDKTNGMGHNAFGAGRRICAGMYVADNSMFINVVTLLWALNIENGGKELPSRTKVIDAGLVV